MGQREPGDLFLEKAKTRLSHGTLIDDDLVFD